MNHAENQIIQVIIRSPGCLLSDEGLVKRRIVVMRTATVKEPRKRKIRESVPSGEATVPGKEPVHGHPVSPCDDLHVRIAQRAYEIYVERGARAGYALSDWLEAEREILGSECQA